MTRAYRGATYEITIEKPEGLCKGHAALTLDREQLPDNVLLLQGDGKVYEVRAVVADE